MNCESDGDDLGDASDGGGKSKKSLLKTKDARVRARTIPQKQDEQDAVGTPDRKPFSLPYRRSPASAIGASSRGPGHLKRKGKNHR